MWPLFPAYDGTPARILATQTLRSADAHRKGFVPREEIYFHVSGHIYEAVNGNRQNHVFRKREQGGSGREEEPGD